MKYLPLLWRNLTSKKLRNAFTFLAVLFAFLLYGLLAAFENAFGVDIEVAGADRLRMVHKISVVQALPLRYFERIAATEGVAAATYTSWFGGVYREARNFFPQYAVEPTTFLAVYPEYRLPEEQRRRWLATRTGAVVGQQLAERFGWRVGDRLSLRSEIYRHPDGSDVWEFTLEGIFRVEDRPVEERQMFFHHDYLEEGSPSSAGEVRWYAIRIDDPARAAQVAERLDRQFANSAAETKTSTEKAFLQSFANQVGNTAAMLSAVVGVVFFVILLVVGSALAQSVRERVVEFAVLKALGFGDGLVLGLVLAESLLLCGIAGGLGLGLGWLIVREGDPTAGMLGAFHVSAADLAGGGALVLALALASGLLPALGAMRLRIVETLRRA